jgi:hypothetical protein
MIGSQTRLDSPDQEEHPPLLLFFNSVVVYYASDNVPCQKYMVNKSQILMGILGTDFFPI